MPRSAVCPSQLKAAINVSGDAVDFPPSGWLDDAERKRCVVNSHHPVYGNFRQGVSTVTGGSTNGVAASDRRFVGSSKIGG